VANPKDTWNDSSLGYDAWDVATPAAPTLRQRDLRTFERDAVAGRGSQQWRWEVHVATKWLQEKWQAWWDLDYDKT